MVAPLLLLLLPSVHAFVGRVPLQQFHETRLNNAPIQTAQSTVITTTNNKPPYKHYNSTMAPITPKLQSYQLKHAPIASSFQPSTFAPLPLLSNKHVQTIGGVFLRSDPNLAYYTDLPSLLLGLARTLFNIRQNEYITTPSSTTLKNIDWYYDVRERIVTPDGGAFFTVDHKYYNPHSTTTTETESIEIIDSTTMTTMTTSTTSEESKGTVIIIHGLESNSNSSLCTDMSTAFVHKGYDVSVINFRGCCGTNVSALYHDGTLIKNGENTLMYHLGFVDDLIYYLSLLASKQSDTDGKKKKPIYLSGFSLGANVILKALGQLGTTALELGVVGAAVAGAPFDTERNYMQFHRDPISRIVYVENLLNKLKERARDILNVQYDGDVNAAGFDYKGSMDANTIYELETACVAPLFGFDDHIDYYRKTSCGYYLESIAVPTYVVNARDDPFFDSSYVPWDKVYGGESGDDTGNNGGAPVNIVFTDEGGHLGYIFHEADGNNGDSKKASWISEELARFVEHAHGEMFTKQGEASIGSLPRI